MNQEDIYHNKRWDQDTFMKHPEAFKKSFRKSLRLLIFVKLEILKFTILNWSKYASTI